MPTENPKTVEDAIKASGMRTLSVLRSRAHKLNDEELKKLTEERDSARATRGYAGPYNTPTPGEGRLDARNYWTSRQETASAGGIPPVEELPDVAPVTLYPTSYSHGPGSVSASFSVSVTGPSQSGSWTVDKQGEATWLHLSSPPEDTPQTAEHGSVIYSVDANESGSARTGDFYINGKTFKVNQNT